LIFLEIKRKQTYAAVMSFPALNNLIARRELIGSAVLVIIGVTLITLAPAKQPAERASTVA